MSSVKAAVVYPQTSSASGSGQENYGPYEVPSCIALLRVEVRGEVNFQGATISDTSVTANYQLYAVQYVAHGAAAADIVSTADGLPFLLREQTGRDDTLTTWAPNTDSAAILGSLGLRAQWAGQLQINESIDLYLSFKSPGGQSVPNHNLFASLRFWWSSLSAWWSTWSARARDAVGRYRMPWWAIASANLQDPTRASRGDVSCPERASVTARLAHLMDSCVMANRARMTITVTASRGASNVSFQTKGRYISLPVNGLGANLPRQPVQPTANELAFWQSVLAIVTAELPVVAGLRGVGMVHRAAGNRENRAGY